MVKKKKSVEKNNSRRNLVVGIVVVVLLLVAGYYWGGYGVTGNVAKGCDKFTCEQDCYRIADGSAREDCLSGCDECTGAIVSGDSAYGEPEQNPIIFNDAFEDYEEEGFFSGVLDSVEEVIDDLFGALLDGVGGGDDCETMLCGFGCEDGECLPDPSLEGGEEGDCLIAGETCSDGFECCSGLCSEGVCDIDLVFETDDCLVDDDCTSPFYPYCDTLPILLGESSGKCAICFGDGDCLGDLRCKHNDGARGDDNECIDGCLSDPHCTDPALPACDYESNTCIECTESSHCDSNSNGDRCMEGNYCGCNNNFECDSGDYCSGGLCNPPACRNTMTGNARDEGCDTITPICDTDIDPANNVCVECINNRDCPLDNPTCTSNYCGSCYSDDDCSRIGEPVRFCNIFDGNCFRAECVFSSECTNPAVPYCQRDINEEDYMHCVACTDDSQCGGTFCDTTTHTCYTGF